MARHFGNCGVAEYVIADVYDTRDLEYLKRCGMKPEDVQRPPPSGDWHGFLPEEIAEGQNRVIVNLDTLEYIDPVKLGQSPTLAGMVSLPPKDRDLPILKKANQENPQIIDAAGGLFVMLSIQSAAAVVTSPLTLLRWVASTRVKSESPSRPDGCSCRKDDVLLGPVQCPPGTDAPLQGAANTDADLRDGDAESRRIWLPAEGLERS